MRNFPVTAGLNSHVREKTLSVAHIFRSPRRRTATIQRRRSNQSVRNRLDAFGIVLLSAALILALAIVVPGVQAGKSDSTLSDTTNSGYNLPKSFKGKLPITQLTEDEAILHALDRLAYGPRPGDVDRIRKIGLEKWIDQQLNYDSIDDSALQEKLAEFKTLKMSSEQLLDKYPPPNQTAKRQGLTPEEVRQQYQQEMQSKRQEMRQQGIDPSMIQFETMPGPQRIQAELDLATIDRAIYSNRQLYEVMSNFWFNHFNVNVTKGADRWLLTDYVERTIRPNAMGKFENLLDATAKSPAMLFYLDNWLSADPIAFQHMQQELALRRQRFQGLFMGMETPAPRQFPQAGRFPNGQSLQGPPKKQDRGLNENYGREVMELHTVGVNGGYTQADV